MGKKQTKIDLDIETSLNDVNNIESFFSSSVDSVDFNCLNVLIEGNFGFGKMKIPAENGSAEVKIISVSTENYNPYSELISEKEFFKIVGYRNGKISSRSGNYQKKLLSHYLVAKEEKDFGYIKDVLEKAVILDNYLKFGKVISKNRKFMKEWKQNISEFSPLQTIKHKGNIKIINVIRNRII